MKASLFISPPSSKVYTNGEMLVQLSRGMAAQMVDLIKLIWNAVRSPLPNNVYFEHQLGDGQVHSEYIMAERGSRWITNGAVVAGTYWAALHGRSFESQITVQTMKLEGLTAAVNVMYVDHRGEAALIVVRLANGDPVQQ